MNYGKSMIQSMIIVSDNWRERRKIQKCNGTRGIQDGSLPRLLDAAEIVKLEWENLSERTIRRCFIKSQILPPNLHHLILAISNPKQTKYKTIQSTPTHDQHQQQTASVLIWLK
jgi:hypothetical protein